MQSSVQFIAPEWTAPEVLIMSKKKKIPLVIALILLIAFTFWMKGCVDIDKCLDNGGRWNYEKGVCEPGRVGATPPRPPHLSFSLRVATNHGQG